MISFAVLSLAVALFVTAIIKRRASRRRPLPPGPPTLPLIGNILDLPKERPWVQYNAMAKVYGDMMFFDIPLQSILVINSADIALELLEKRSEIYSDRVQMRMAKLISWGFSVALKPYGPQWREYRRFFHQYTKPEVLRLHYHALAEETQSFVLRLIEEPKEASGHVRYLLASSILRMVYGMRIKSLTTDDHIALAAGAIEGATLAMTPGKNFVEFFPFLRHIPSWLPGGHTQRFVDKYLPIVQKMINQPYNKVKSATDDGSVTPCLLHSVLEDLQTTYPSGVPPEVEEMAKGITAIMYFSATDTTVATCSAFLVAMAMFPEVQKKAQAELDRVIGRDRLPGIADLESMVYVQAVVLETLRWMPAAPLALPHLTSADDWYNGYFIPKGTIVFANSWAILRNQDDYPEPDLFKPERYIKDGKINPDVRSPDTFAFGYGRRKCPGKEWANDMLLLFTASILQIVTITPGLDDDGKPVQLLMEQTTGFISDPTTTPRGFAPRFKGAERLLRDSIARF